MNIDTSGQVTTSRLLSRDNLRMTTGLMEVTIARSLSAAFLFLLSCAAFANDTEPVMDESQVLEAMRYCQTAAVRAAWGAQARFLGAPPLFKYISETPLKRMFMGDDPIPADAIYVLDELNAKERHEYEAVALHGWTQADTWVREGRKQPDYELLAAVFYQGCKEMLIPGTKDPRTSDEITVH
ncbi:MAG: hypothetical protein HY067_10440 [Betaproteobacteria bacterium]|nr:hypothetical protein [Betaproteobacteria bacterium]